MINMSIKQLPSNYFPNEELLEKLYSFLKTEIESELLKVSGTARRIIWCNNLCDSFETHMKCALALQDLE